jgi:hypothetical protein
MKDLDQFIAFLREEEKRSYDPALADERAVALDYYNGELFGDEQEGRSQVVTRDVAEVVDYMTISILRTMISGDRVVEFDGSDPDLAEQATLAVSQSFFQGQRGYRFLHDWIKAGLLEKSSVAKTMVEPQPPIRNEAVVSIDELTMLHEHGVKVIEVTPLPQHDAPQPGMPHEPEQFHVVIAEPQPVLFRDYVVPNEQASFAQDADDLDDNCVYVGFHNWRTLSQLKEMGFETDGLGDNTNIAPEQMVLAIARDDLTNQNRYIYNRHGPNRRIIHHEEYVRYDLNDDGIAELLLVHRVNNTILIRVDTGEMAIEEIDEQPGAVWSPFPSHHRIVGQSLADKVMDIQRTSSVLMRQALDNLYQSNAPRWVVDENSLGDNTMDDLLTVRAGSLIRYSGGQPPTAVALPFTAQSAFDALEVLRGDKESRTGITRLNQGLDADALNKTATGTALQMASGQQIEEYLARNFAEGFARLMLKKYRLMRKYGAPFQITIDGKPTQVDPRQWPENMQVVVRVGLGTGRKDGRIAYRTQLLQIAQQALAGGSQIFSEDNLYNNIKGLVADMSIGAVSSLITDPSTLPPAPPPPPDPKMAIEQAKLTADQQKAQTQAALESQKAQLAHQAAQDKLVHDAQIAQLQAHTQVLVQQARADADIQAQAANHAHEYNMAMLAQEHQRSMAAKPEITA